MKKKSNVMKNIITVLLTLLIMGLAAGTASASQARPFPWHGAPDGKTRPQPSSGVPWCLSPAGRRYGNDGPED